MSSLVNVSRHMNVTKRALPVESPCLPAECRQFGHAPEFGKGPHRHPDRLGSRLQLPVSVTSCDAAFPLSDHADFPDLVEFVKQVLQRKFILCMVLLPISLNICVSSVLRLIRSVRTNNSHSL